MEIPVIDLSPYVDVKSGKFSCDELLHPELKNVCKEVSRILRETGALLVRDPRCSSEDNDRFIDMMEKYFEQPDEVKRVQERPHQHYQGIDLLKEGFASYKESTIHFCIWYNSVMQVGSTPGGVEIPRSMVDLEMQKKLRALPKDRQPTIPTTPDLKSRYMWRVGPRPSNTRFKELNSEPVIPEGFPEWEKIMDSWGFKMISTVEAVAEMAAIGFDLPKDSFTNLMKLGPHLLAPTGSDLGSHGEEGTVFAGYHYDINFLTIHYKSKFPGLSIWLRNGEKVEVKVPEKCLLIQAGKQLEWMTAGDCKAGMHEVVVTPSTLDAIKVAKQENRSLWRVSSTLFSNVASDAVLKPLGHFAKSPLADSYPPMYAGDYFEKELSEIKLKGQTEVH